MWPRPGRWLSLLELVPFFMLQLSCRGGRPHDMAKAATHPNPTLHARVQPQSFTVSMPETEYTATITVAETIFRQYTSNLAARILQDATDMGPSARLPSYQVWPARGYVVKFELRRANPRRSTDPPVDAALLQGIAKVMQAHLVGRGIQGFDANFAGTVSTAAAGPALFEFRMHGVHPQLMTPEKQPWVTFGPADLDVIADVKAQITAETTPDDLLLFIGNTAAYFYYAFASSPSTNRNTRLLPLSSHIFAPRSREPLFTQAGYATYLRTVLLPAFTPPPKGRVILIDHVRTGASIRALATFLSPAYASLIRPPQKVYVLNLAYPEPSHMAEDVDDPSDLQALTQGSSSAQQGGLDIEFIAPPGVVVARTTGRANNAALVRFDYGLVGRVLPYYSPELWETEWEAVPNADAEWAKLIRTAIEERFGCGTPC
ncbi:hypothetical protein MMC24_003943 [Lignoscripta atroalba]|nr:hypothetical protein [Lignoscripta atroalba]